MFQCAFYEKEITPPLGCHIPGYFNLRAGSNVKDRLYARAAVIKNDENVVAMISVDGCVLRGHAPFIAKVKERINQYVNIPTENILLGFTHVHTGIPHYSEKKTDESWENQTGYFDVLYRLLADCVVLAYYRLENSKLSFAEGMVEGISFCRDYFMKNGTPQTNPPRTSPDISGPTDETDNRLPILFAKGEDGTPKGAIISFACHPDCVGGTEYSGDYISELSRQLKKEYGEDFVTVFLQGTSGNINHFDVSKKEDAPDHYLMMGRKIAEEAIKALKNAEELSGDAQLRCRYEVLKIDRRSIPEETVNNAKHIVATVQEIPGVKIAADNTDPEQYALAMSKRLLEFLETIPEVLDVPVQFIGIGEFKLYAFTSEIFCHFGRYIKENCGTDKVMVATMCNGAYGYVPTREMFYDTIYESRPGSNQLNEEAGYIMADKLLEMGK